MKKNLEFPGMVTSIPLMGMIMNLGKKNKGIGRKFLIFTTIASIVIVFFCINFLQVKSELTYRMHNVAELESQLSQLQQDNDAYENTVRSSLDMNRIRLIATSKLGMKYPDIS